MKTDISDTTNTGSHLTGTFWAWHKRYSLGTSSAHKPRHQDYGSWNELKTAVAKAMNPVVILPVYMLDHGGRSFSTSPFTCPWDSGQVGFIFATREDVKQLGIKRVTARMRTALELALTAQVARMNELEADDTY
jgi:hypothetical protein